MSTYIAVKPMQLIVRCFAERDGDQWLAFSVDFGLAAQADTLQDAKAKLDAMIQSYVEDALIGEDQAYAKTLLSRKAPLSITLRYYAYRLLEKLRPSKEGRTSNIFDKPLHLSPASLGAVASS